MAIDIFLGMRRHEREGESLLTCERPCVRLRRILVSYNNSKRPAPPRRYEARGQQTRLKAQTVGALPIIDHFLERLRLEEFLQGYLGGAQRTHMVPAKGLLILLKNILLGREPLYGIQEWADRHEPRHLGVTARDIDRLNDDRVGRCLDRVFDAGYSSLVLAVTRHVLQEFGLRLDQLHSDTTTLTFFGAYEQAVRGRKKRGKETLAVVLGFNKDHRPDLKQLLMVLTVSADGGVPVHFTALDGNTADDQTHIGTWNLLHELRGGPDFTYVADSKLATRKNMGYITARGGRFITVLPRTRGEDSLFRERLRHEALPWSEIHRKVEGGADGHEKILDVISVSDEPARTEEGYRLLWYHSSRKEEVDREARTQQISRALQELDDFQGRLEGPRTRFRERAKVAAELDKILAGQPGAAFLTATVREAPEERYRQDGPGRPGSTTRYRREVRTRFRLDYQVNREAVARDSLTDGIFPLITNEEDWSEREVYLAYKKQPLVERRFCQAKSGLEVTPVLLKEVARIEALACIYYLALLVCALIERELRQAMKRERISSLPLYPEARDCEAPTAKRVLDLFDNIQKHTLFADNKIVDVLRTELSPAQIEILRLLGISPKVYSAT
jgi:transposase